MTNEQTIILKNLVKFTKEELDTDLITLSKPDSGKSFEQYITGTVEKISVMFSIDSKDIYKEIGFSEVI